MTEIISTGAARGLSREGIAGRPKIVEECTFPLTGRRVVTRVYTDLAVFHVAGGQLRLKECAPGVRPGAVRGRTAATYVEDFSA